MGFIKKLAFLSIWRWSNPLYMRWYTGVLVIEKCQGSGMQQVQISGVYGLGTLSRPSSSRGCSSRILECKTWTDSFWSPWTVTSLPMPGQNFVPRAVTWNMKQNPSVSILPKRIQGIVTQIGQKEPDRREILLRRPQSQCYKWGFRALAVSQVLDVMQRPTSHCVQRKNIR